MFADLTLPPWTVFYPYVIHAVRLVVILLGAWGASHLARRLVSRLLKRVLGVMSRHAETSDQALEKRAATIGGVLRNAVAVTIWIIALMMGLKEIGFDVGPLLAGAGIAGLAIGFGAQNLVRDFITGMFLLIENQIRVNDVVQINGVGGLVEEINLRTTVLRGLDGAVHIFPNGAIHQVSNLTREFSYYVFEIGVAYKEDTDRVSEVMSEVAAELREDPEYAPLIKEPLEILGVDQFADSAVIIKARIKTEPVQQWTIGRELNRRFKKRFDELGIEIPFPHVSVSMGEASKPFPLHIDAASRQEWKELIREVLEELREAEPSGQAHADGPRPGSAA